MCVSDNAGSAHMQLSQEFPQNALIHQFHTVWGYGDGAGCGVIRAISRPFQRVYGGFMPRCRLSVGNPDSLGLAPASFQIAVSWDANLHSKFFQELISHNSAELWPVRTPSCLLRSRTCGM